MRTLFEANMDVQPSLDFGNSIGFFKEIPDTFDLGDVTKDMAEMESSKGHTVKTFSIFYNMIPAYRTKDGIHVTGFGLHFGEPYVMAVLPGSLMQRPKYLGGHYGNNVILPRWVKYDVRTLLRRKGEEA